MISAQEIGVAVILALISAAVVEAFRGRRTRRTRIVIDIQTSVDD